jgi:hypothetical protein
MKKNSTVATKRKKIFNENKLTIGMDLEDQFTYYCVLDEAGEVMVEQKLPADPRRMRASLRSHAAAQVRHTASEQGFGFGAERGVASCLGTTAGGSAIAQPADRGV